MNKLKQYWGVIMALLIITFILLQYYFFEFQNNYNPEDDDIDQEMNQYNDIPSKLQDISKSTKQIERKIVIGAVCCREKDKTDLNNTEINKYNEQTTVMIKSVLISAKLYNISTVEIHLFLEHVKEDEKYFKEKIQNMGFLNDDDDQQKVRVTLKFHSAVEAVPKKYHDHMVYHKRFRCGYTRFFFPSALPDVDSIVYLDSDMIVTGNIISHWEELLKMDKTEMVGAAFNRDPGNDKYPEEDELLFGGIPHVSPRGVNNGMLIMNLTKMRKYGFEEKISRVYDDYSKLNLTLTGQKVVNILLYYSPDILRIVPCTLNFISDACEIGFYCEAAKEDPVGIHLVHGTDSRFMDGRVFHEIYKNFEEFNMTSPEADIFKRVMEPIRNHYAVAGKDKFNCYGTLNKVLFKKFSGSTYL